MSVHMAGGIDPRLSLLDHYWSYWITASTQDQFQPIRVLQVEFYSLAPIVFTVIIWVIV